MLIPLRLSSGYTVQYGSKIANHPWCAHVPVFSAELADSDIDGSRHIFEIAQG
jgi:hypothetical protein